jgi:hypothetical protein
MTNPYTVALVVDPNFGAHLGALAARMHTWIVATPENSAAAEIIWNLSANTKGNGLESGVTTFIADLKSDREGWCDAILDSIDEHHNSYSHDPGYTVLEVYGVPFTERLGLAFAECGFASFEQTEFGFRARKPHLK